MIKDIANSFKEYENVRNGNVGVLSLAQITYASTNMSQAKKNLPKWQYLNVQHCFDEYCTKTDKNLYDANTLYSETIKMYYQFDFWGCIKQYAGNSPIALAWKETEEKAEMRNSYLLLKNEYMKSHDNSILEKIKNLASEFQKINESINDEDSLMIRAFESGEVSKIPENVLRTKYCKHCGSPLDINNKCTGCGKQYFKMPKINIRALFIILLLSMVCTLTYNYKLLAKNNEELKKENDILSSNNDDMLNHINNIEDELDYYKAECEACYEIFNEMNIAFVLEGEDYYHKATCEKIEENYDKTVYYDTVYKLIDAGYKSCPYCH